MDMKRQAALVRALVRKTNSKEIEWREAARNDMFQVDINNGGVQLFEVGSDVCINIVNEYGVVVETFSDSDLKNNVGNDDLWYTTMKDLVSSARRSALGSDEILDSILRQLER